MDGEIDLIGLITKYLKRRSAEPPEPSVVPIVPCSPPPTGLLILTQPLPSDDKKDEKAVVLRVGTTLVDDGTQSDMTLRIRALLSTPPVPVFVRSDILRKYQRKEKIKQYAAKAAVKGAAEGAKYAGVPGADALGEIGGDALDEYFERVAERENEEKARYYESHRLMPYPYEVSVQGCEVVTDTDDSGKSHSFNYYAVYTHLPLEQRKHETTYALKSKYGRKTRLIGTAFPASAAYTVRYKRYTDFADLDALVEAMLPTEIFESESVSEPKPGFFNHQKESYIQSRIEDLNFYIVSLNHIFHSPELRELIEQWLNEGVGMSATEFHRRQKGQRKEYTEAGKKK